MTEPGCLIEENKQKTRGMRNGEGVGEGFMGASGGDGGHWSLWYVYGRLRDARAVSIRDVHGEPMTVMNDRGSSFRL